MIPVCKRIDCGHEMLRHAVTLAGDGKAVTHGPCIVDGCTCERYNDEAGPDQGPRSLITPDDLPGGRSSASSRILSACRIRAKSGRRS